MYLCNRKIASMIDYIWWVQSFHDNQHRNDVISSFRSDNGSVIDIAWYSLILIWRDTIIVSVSYLDHSLPVLWISLIKPWWQPTLKRDLYGKWLVYLRETADWSNLFDVFRFLWIYYPCLTRYDHCIDTIHTWWENKARFKDNFQCKITNSYKTWIQKNTKDRSKITYQLYWSKRSSKCIRIYDKTLDLTDSWHERLYPQYKDKHIMRYELQVNSKWIDKQDKKITFDQIRSLAYQSYQVPANTTTHKKLHAIKWLHHHIRSIRKESSYDQLLSLRDLLNKQLIIINNKINDYEYLHQLYWDKTKKITFRL